MNASVGNVSNLLQIHSKSEAMNLIYFSNTIEDLIVVLLMLLDLSRMQANSIRLIAASFSLHAVI